MKVLGYGASHCSFTPPDFYTSAGERQGEQQFCNIITIFHVATKNHSEVESGNHVCVSRGYPQSPEREERDQTGRSCSVLDPAA